MNSLRLLFLVLLNVGVAAPAAASPGVPAATWPGVSDVLLNVVAAPVAACSSCGLNDSEQPGSVLIFPKFIRGTFVDALSGQALHARTELEISVVCPRGATCTQDVVRMRAHWVCPGSTTDPVCAETSFNLETTVGGTLYFNPEGVTTIAGVLTAAAFPSNATTIIPLPPCQRGYLIVWVTDGGGNAIKFDGLIGDAVLRDPTPGELTRSAQAYNAIPIQATDFFSTGDLTDSDLERDLDFDDIEYEAVTGRIFGTVRYENLVALGGPVRTDLTLLTLDVASSRQNPVTTVGLNFYTPNEQVADAATSFVCWTEQRLTSILGSATVQSMGRKGFVESYFAEQNGVPVTLLGIVETREFLANEGNQHRDYAYSLFHDGNPVPTSFRP
jgi:hypothetical protein